MMLHTVNKSPFEKDSLATCIRLSAAGSSILLLEDGVYGAIKGSNVETAVLSGLKDRKIYALCPDLMARGIDRGKLIDGIEVVDYDDFVRLAVEAPKVQSWL